MFRDYDKYKVDRDQPDLSGLKSADLKKRKEARKILYNKKREARMAFKRDLEDEYGTVSNPKADLLFRKAWDMGHSNGLQEVEHYYEDLVDLIE